MEGYKGQVRYWYIVFGGDDCAEWWLSWLGVLISGIVHLCYYPP